MTDTRPPRPSVLHRLGRACFRRHWFVVAAWVVALAGVSLCTSAFGTKYTEDFGDFHSEAVRGMDLLDKGFGGSAGGEQGTIVFRATDGVYDPAVRETMSAFLARVARIPGVDVASPYAPHGERRVAYQGPLAGRLAYADVQFPPDLSWKEAQQLARRVEARAPHVDGLQIEYGGEMFGEFEPPSSEMIGLGFAIVILIVVFGSVLAMGLPIGVALGGIGTGIGVIGLLSRVVTMPDLVTTLATMIGLGVGIDYALFIVTRVREDLHRGSTNEDATAHAIDTAGRAVLFAGITVVISVLGMLVMGIGFIRGLAIGSATVVAFTLVASVTLLPALLGVVSTRLEVTTRRALVAAVLVAIALVGMGLKFDLAAVLLPVAAVVFAAGFAIPSLRTTLPPRRVKERSETAAYRWSRVIQHRPWRATIGGLVLLVALAGPVFSMRLGFSDNGNAPASSTVRKAYDLLAEGFGPGFNGPLLIAATVPPSTPGSAFTRITVAVAGTPGVAQLTAPDRNADGTVARWIVVPRTAPQDAATTDLVHRLRNEVIPEASVGSGMDVMVTGSTATGVDVSAYLAARYPAFFVAVLGLSFLLLMTVFRSVLVPLKAVIMNLLSIGAAYGIVVAVFQWGWLKQLVGVGKGGPVEPFVPMMLFAIVFGLSMDYEVFLLSRIREEYDRTHVNASAVADGLAVTARVITAAALIMVTVFGSFLLENERTVKEIGLGLALAVLLDASIVRMLLVPATMELLGDWNWWLPKWLARVLPRVNVEGAALPEPGAAAPPVVLTDARTGEPPLVASRDR
jgi:RND superfamily putative drug exporter